MSQRPIVLVTGASRSVGIGSSIAKELAQSGEDYMSPPKDIALVVEVFC